jgi:hypothetical protein
MALEDIAAMRAIHGSTVRQLPASGTPAQLRHGAGIDVDGIVDAAPELTRARTDRSRADT